jgi:hypothetical protein
MEAVVSVARSTPGLHARKTGKARGRGAEGGGGRENGEARVWRGSEVGIKKGKHRLLGALGC